MTIYIDSSTNNDVIEEFDLNDNAFSNSDEPTVENNDDDLIDMAMDTGASIGLKADKKKKKKKKNSKVCVDEC